MKKELLDIGTWNVNVLEDIKSINLRNWKKVGQNRDSWEKVVEQAGSLYRL
jgi:hypothetical protein